MNDAPPNPPRNDPARTGGSWRIVVGLAIVAVLWFHWWTVESAPPYGLVEKEAGSYSNLLLRGLLKGQLAMDVPADPFLATLANPYDPVARAGHGLHDASYYNGKYYLYFGVTPVLLLHLPFRLLTGHWLTDHGAVLVFAAIGFLASWAVFRSLVRVHLPRTPGWVLLAGVLALGLANMVPPMLRRPAIWEVSIAGAYAMFMLTLLAVWRAMNVERRRGTWLVGASLLMGCCIGARPTYLPMAVVLLAPLFARAPGGRFWRQPAWGWTMTATLLPIMAVGAGLAAYNYGRFGNWFEFGQTYQMAGAEDSKLVHFSASYLPFNLQVYLLSAPGLTPYFPFLTVITPPPVPAGQFGMENPYGIIPGIPWVLFGVVTMWFAITRRGPLGAWCAALLAGSGLTLLLLSFFGGVTNRYQVDFTPGLVLAAAVGVASLAAEAAQSRWRPFLLAVVGLAAAWSVGFNVLVSLQHNRLLELNRPEVYAAIARVANRLPQVWAGLTGHRDGPVELRLTFPEGRNDRVEALVTTGRSFLADYVYVHYLNSGMIRFGYVHTSRGAWSGPATVIDPAKEHRLVVQMGSLYPPAAHPGPASWTEAEREERLRTVRVLLDGRTVLLAKAEAYDATEWNPTLGTSGPRRPAFKNDFSGRILGWRRLEPLASPPLAEQAGSLHLLLRLPEFTRVRNEPILSTGKTGQGDLIYVRYLDANHFQLGHDRWGYGGVTLPVMEYNPADALDLDIACAPLLGEGAAQRLQIRINGRVVYDEPESFHPSEPGEVVVGHNRIGASTAEADFTGVLEIQERIAD